MPPYRLALILFFFPLTVWASATSTLRSDYVDETLDSLLPNFIHRHQLLLTRHHQGEGEEKSSPVREKYTKLSTAYAEKSEVLYALSLKTLIFSFEWREKEIENYLPDAWTLNKIDHLGLSYAIRYGELEEDQNLHVIDLRALAIRFILIAYYYNTQSLLQSPKPTPELVERKHFLESRLNDMAVTPYWSWNLENAYTRKPMPTGDKMLQTHRITQECIANTEKYSALINLTENFEAFLQEMDYESRNGILLRASSKTGHQDLGQFGIEVLVEDYHQLHHYWSDQLNPVDSSHDTSPRTTSTSRLKRQIFDHHTDIEKHQLHTAQKHLLAFSIIASDILEMPGVYEAKLLQFSDPSKEMHRALTHQTLSRVSGFVASHYLTIIKILQERFEFMITTRALLHAKKAEAPFHPHFDIMVRQYLLAEPTFYESTLNHLNRVVLLYEAPAHSLTSPASSASTDHKKKGKKPFFGGFSEAISRLKLSHGGSSSEKAPPVTHINPIFNSKRRTSKPDIKQDMKECAEGAPSLLNSKTQHPITSSSSSSTLLEDEGTEQREQESSPSSSPRLREFAIRYRLLRMNSFNRCEKVNPPHYSGQPNLSPRSLSTSQRIPTTEAPLISTVIPTFEALSIKDSHIEDTVIAPPSDDASTKKSIGGNFSPRGEHS